MIFTRHELRVTDQGLVAFPPAALTSDFPKGVLRRLFLMFGGWDAILLEQSN